MQVRGRRLLRIREVLLASRVGRHSSLRLVPHRPQGIPQVLWWVEVPRDVHEIGHVWAAAVLLLDTVDHAVLVPTHEVGEVFVAWQLRVQELVVLDASLLLVRRLVVGLLSVVVFQAVKARLQGLVEGVSDVELLLALLLLFIGDDRRQFDVLDRGFL